jgi:hypothetical protein
MKMKQLEMITVRVSGRFEEETCRYLKEFCRDVRKSDGLNVDLLISTAFPGDLAVVLSWQEQPSVERKTVLGSILVESLKHFGLVDHTCWQVVHP